MLMPPITLITDFGLKDHYVGVMKGVMLTIAPRASIVDITHDIAPQNISQAAFVLRQVVEWYPAGSIHVVVVDPGVGSGRRILAGRYAGQIVILPDNGLVSHVHRQWPVEALFNVTNTRFFHEPVSHTFHGRDIIAPVAAHVASGVPLEQLGPPVADIELLQLSDSTPIAPRGRRGAILYVDRFGNLVTNIGRSDLAETLRQAGPVSVYLGDVCIGPINRTFSDVPVGEPAAMVGSSGMLEIVVNCGHAGDVLSWTPDMAVEVR